MHFQVQQFCRHAECFSCRKPRPRPPGRRRHGKTRTRQAFPLLPTLPVRALATPRGCYSLRRPGQESPSSVKWKPADTARPVHSNPLIPAAAPTAPKKCRCESASSLQVSATCRSGGCSERPVGETYAIAVKPISTLPPSPPQTRAGPASRLKPSQRSAYRRSDLSPPRRTLLMIRRTRGSSRVSCVPRAARRSTNAAASRPETTRITAPPCSTDIRRCPAPAPL